MSKQPSEGRSSLGLCSISATLHQKPILIIPHTLDHSKINASNGGRAPCLFNCYHATGVRLCGIS